MANLVAPTLDRSCPSCERAPIVRLAWMLLLLVLAGCESKRTDVLPPVSEERGSNRIAAAEHYLKASGESTDAVRQAASVFEEEKRYDRALAYYRKLVFRSDAQPDDKLNAAKLIYRMSDDAPPVDHDLWRIGVQLIIDVLESGESCSRRELLLNYYRGHPDERLQLEMALSRCFQDHVQLGWLRRMAELATSDVDRARYYCLSVSHTKHGSRAFLEECLQLSNYLPPQDWTVQLARGLALQEKDPAAAIAILEPLLSARDDLVAPNEALAQLARDAGRRELACQALVRAYRTNLKAVAHSTDPRERELPHTYRAVLESYGCKKPK